MNFISNVLDALPVVGHVKGIVHYAVGDDEGGHKAMYQSTRTAAVLAGGAAGCLAGPAGAVAGAMYAGIATDGIASIAMDKPQGIIQGCESIGKDISAGKNPTGSILTTGLQLGLDGVGGLGMGGLSSAASQVSEKAVAKTLENVGKKALSTVGEEMIEKTVQLSGHEMAKLVGKKVSEKAVERAIKQAVVQTEVALVTAHIGLNASKRTQQEKEEEEKKEQQERERIARERRERERREKEEKERKEKESQNNAGRNQGQSSGSSQPPQKNNNNNKQTNKPDYLDIFKKLLKRLLQLIYGNKKEPFTAIFDNLSEKQIKYLIGVIEATMNSGTLDEVIELVLRIFKGNNKGNNNLSSDNLFEDFFSLLEFVRAYLLNEIDIRETVSTINTQGTREQRRAQILRDIMNERHVFENLSVGQIEYLIGVIKATIKSGTLEEVIKLVLRIFKGHMSSDMSFENFLSLMEFVRAYILNKIDIRETESTMYTQGTHEQRRAQILRDIMNERQLVEIIVGVFRGIASEIRAETAPPNNISPDFRDIFAAVYHYFKHRKVKRSKTLSTSLEDEEYYDLTVKEYYDWIRKILKKLKQNVRYREEVENQRGPVTCIYEVYVTLFGRRFRIVVKVWNGDMVLSSAFVVNMEYLGDTEGKDKIVIKKKKK